MKALLYGLTLMAFLQLCPTNAKAQYVVIPDSAFVYDLKNAGLDSCFSGNMLDTTCPALRRLKSFYPVLKITNFEGLQYCDSLEALTYLGGNFMLVDTLKIPALPPRLVQLIIYSARIDKLPPIPLSVETLLLGSMMYSVDNIPDLPDGLKQLQCSSCGITSLPRLPIKLKVLNLSSSEFLTSLPELPDSLDQLNLAYCTRLKCLPQLKTIQDLNLYTGGITCLPNYGNIVTCNPPLNTFPLCNYFNTNGCPIYYNISGKVYADETNDCTYNTFEHGIVGVNLHLYQNGQLVQTANTTPGGLYTLNAGIATYNYSVDTAGFPFSISCPTNGFYSSTFNSPDSIETGRDFAVECQPGYDLVAQSIVTDEDFIPGRYTELFATGGDYTNFYGVYCATGISGAVVLSLDPLVTYVANAPGARVPSSVTANAITWNIADFADVDFMHDFDILMKTDTTAQAGQAVCLTLTINPIAGDNNPANNVLNQCFEVQSSFDPNEKEVYPLNIIDTATKELTYTIHFQNTGNVSARHIHVDDTLDNAIDRSSIKLVAYSHYPEMTVTDKALRFNFRNIFLPDSNTNEPSSKGYVQYKARLKNNLPVGTQIKNTAHIYFDYNTAIVTNTTINTISLNTGIAKQPAAEIDFQLYPNPAVTKVTIAVSESLVGGELLIMDLLGRAASPLPTHLTSTQVHLSVKDLPNGVYFVEIVKDGKCYCKKLIISQ